MSPPSSTAAARPRSRCWTLVGPDGGMDVEVVARDDEALGSVLAQLGAVVGSPPTLFSGTSLLPDDLRLADVRLRHGAVLGVDRPAPRGLRQGAPAALELQVVGGPDAGRTLSLGDGTHLVGRSSGSVVHVEDPDVSRRHVEIRVRAGTVEVVDLGSSNGTRLDERELCAAAAAPWPAGSRLRIGATTLTLAGPGQVPAALLPGPAGRSVLRPSVRLPEIRPPVEVVFPPTPAPPHGRRLAWVAVALPAIGGVALAVALHTPSFLFFALLSPLVAVASWWSDRRWGRRAHRRALSDFETRTAAANRQLAEAVRAEARAAHRRHPDLAELARSSRRRGSLLWSRGPGDPVALTVRVGTGPGAVPVHRRDSEGAQSTTPADDLPVTFDLRSSGLAVAGPRSRCLGVLRAAIAQLAALHAPDSVELVLVATAARLEDWRWTRWLPHLRSVVVPAAQGSPSASAPHEDAAGDLLALVERRRAHVRRTDGHGWPGSWTAVVVDGPLPAAVAGALARAADIGITVLTHGEALAEVPVPVAGALTVTGELGTHARLQADGVPSNERVTVDQLPLDVAEDLARDLAGLAPPAGRSALPAEVRFLDLAGPGDGLQHDAAPLSWARGRRSLETALGIGADGVERLDLCRHGPHALVAGTTGAGKSELLQTLIAGLALNHPPDRCSFLLVDYKGGAAFAEAAALPHTVGLLTDLDDAATARALRSLGAELARREAVLAEHAVAHIADLPEQVPLARLVIVVDEFATLAEELPAFVPGLVGIAQRGRSLGIHVVLATQRPAGVVSADIRANCSLRICLRTTDEADSRDVLGGPEAAFLPLDSPGRAYVRTGKEPARLLQVARVSQARPRSADAPSVAPWRWPYRSAVPARVAAGDSDLAVLVRTLQEQASARAIPAPHRPWRPPLPDTLSLTDVAALTGTSPGSPAHVVLGLADRPDEQAQRPLLLDLTEGGGCLAVGGPRSGRTTLLTSVLRQAVSGQAVDRLHVHVVDLGGGGLAAEAATVPQVGTAIGREDPLRTVRLLDRLAEEVARRRSARAGDDPLIMLLVDGVEALCTLLDDADPARGSGEFLRLVRDGGAVGLTCVLTADRAVPGGRLAGLARHRLVLPLTDRADYAVAGIPLTAVPSTRPPGRALVGEDATECQLVLPPPLAPARPSGSSARLRTRPLRIPELDPDPVMEGILAAGARSSLRVFVGPGGDEGELLSVDLLRTGGLLVAGPPGSGRTSTLDALVGDLAAAGAPILRLGASPSPGRGPIVGVDLADVTDATSTAVWLQKHSDRPAVLCIDDLGPAGGAPALGALPHLGATSGVVLLAAASGPDLATWFQGPVAALRRSRSGLLLCPGPGDADVLGVRLPRTPTPNRPGSGWLVHAGAARRVQVSRRRTRGDAGQSSSSTGPISCVAYQASSCPST